MSILNASNLAVDRKNKKQLKKFVSIINNYEESLNNKVDSLINHMINYSKKLQDPLVLPQIRPQKSATERSKSFSKTLTNKIQNTRFTNRDKSISSAFSFIPQISQNMEEKINSLKKSAAESFMFRNSSILPEGRSLGNKKFVKPRFLKKQADVLPRQMRLDPFAQKNIIKAQDLQKGIITLIERGKIGKDVDIITAFQKGGQVLSSQAAVLHQGEQRVARMQSMKREKRQVNDEQNFSKMITKKQKIDFQQNNWAITMPGSEYNQHEGVRRTIDLNTSKPKQINLEQIYHLKFIHYAPVENSEFKKFKIKNISFLSEINSILNQVTKILHTNSIEVAYINSSRVIDLATICRKLSKAELISCILAFKNQSRIPIEQIVNIAEKKTVCNHKIVSLFRMLKERIAFERYLKIKRVQKKISNWLYNFHMAQKFKGELQIHKKEVSQRFSQLQQDFRKSYISIQTSKHYQIHISNKSMSGRSGYKQLLNTEITRIFNFQNPNTYIIMILSEPLAEETKNYYYKIMELEEIPNFRDRVTFLSVNNHYFSSDKFTASQKLYYDSKLVREIKSIIGHSHAYFRISYPSNTDVRMAVFFQIPIFTGDLLKLMPIEQRSQSLYHFGIPELNSFRLQPNEFKPLTMSSTLIEFCKKNKRYRNYVVKINGSYQSKGIGLLTYPFTSLPELYSNTALIFQPQNISASQFYRNLCKKGGIIQVFEQNLSPIVMVGKISTEGDIQLTGSYDKISYGFANIGYFFPQMTISHSQVLPIFNSVSQKLLSLGHFGDFQISLFIDENQQVYLDKVQCYQTEIGSSLFYFKFLCPGELNNKGQFITKITETFETDDNKEEELVTLQPRSYCYIPYILHFGLSQKQVGSFFQLCRMGGISFDLQNKYGSTFILLGSLRDSMGMITTAKDRQTCRKLMIKSFDFIIKQNSHNNSKSFMEEKEIRMRERQNILALKERLEDL